MFKFSSQKKIQSNLFGEGIFKNLLEEFVIFYLQE